jgi:hypothetical protein
VRREKADSTRNRLSFTPNRIIMLCFIERPELGRASTSVALAELHGINHVNRAHTAGHHHHMGIVAAMVILCFDSKVDHCCFFDMAPVILAYRPNSSSPVHSMSRTLRKPSVLHQA